VNSLLAPHRPIVWITWLIAALLFLPVGDDLIYGLIVPLTAGLLVLLARGLVPSAGRHVDGRDIRAVLLLYVGVVTALYLGTENLRIRRRRTQARYSWEVRPSGSAVLLTPVFAGFGRRLERGVWRSMKRFLESGRRLKPASRRDSLKTSLQ
jgi:hypothetical protein